MDRIEYKVVGKWANGQSNTLETTTSQLEAYDIYDKAIKKYPRQHFKIIRVTYKPLASYEPGMEDANDNP